MIKKICLECGKVFYVYPYRTNAKFCSINCMGKSYSGRKLSKKSCKNMSISQTGRKHPHSDKFKQQRQGDGNPHWKGGKYIDKKGYVLIYVPSHPFSLSHGYVLEHRLIMEKHRGRYLKKEEVVHHINKIKNDNRIKNLKLFANDIEHRKIHRGDKNRT